MDKLTKQLLLRAEHTLSESSIIFILTVVGIVSQQAACVHPAIVLHGLCKKLISY